MSVLDFMAKNGVFVPVPGGAVVYLYVSDNDQSVSVSYNYTVGGVRYSGTVTRNTDGSISITTK